MDRCSDRYRFPYAFLCLLHVEKAGSHLSPSVNPLKLEIRDSDGRLNVDALRMTLHAKAPAAEFIGVPLNANQGIEIKDIVLTLPEGIVISGSEK